MSVWVATQPQQGPSEARHGGRGGAWRGRELAEETPKHKGAGRRISRGEAGFQAAVLPLPGST